MQNLDIFRTQLLTMTWQFSFSPPTPSFTFIEELPKQNLDIFRTQLLTITWQFSFSPPTPSFTFIEELPKQNLGNSRTQFLTTIECFEYSLTLTLARHSALTPTIFEALPRGNLAKTLDQLPTFTRRFFCNQAVPTPT